MRKFTRIVQGFVVVIGLLVLATTGQAAVIYTSSQGDGTVSVDLTSGALSITLTDIANNPTSVIQNVSGFVFSTTGGSASSGLSTATSATYISVAGNGTTSSATGPAIWGYSGTSTQYVLTWNPGAGGTGPAFSILGAPGAGGVYSNANGSIANNAPHNPFINQTAIFALSNITGVTGITSGTIMFGTEWSPPSPPSVPEAGTLLMFGTGLIGLVGYRRIRRMQ